jgi:hypothetical protein
MLGVFNPVVGDNSMTAVAGGRRTVTSHGMGMGVIGSLAGSIAIDQRWSAFTSVSGETAKGYSYSGRVGVGCAF